MLNDDEMAQMLVELEADDDSAAMPWAPPFEDYTTQAKLLSMAVDGINELLAATVKLKTGKTLNIKPVPSPRTAVDTARQRRDVQAAINVAGMFGFSPEEF